MIYVYLMAIALATIAIGLLFLLWQLVKLYVTGELK